MAHPLDAAARKYLHASSADQNKASRQVIKKKDTTAAMPNSQTHADGFSLDPMKSPSPTKGAAGSTKSPRFRPAQDPLGDPDKAYGFADGGKAGKGFVPKEEGRLPPAKAPAPDLPPNPEQSPALNPNPGGSRMPHANPTSSGSGPDGLSAPPADGGELGNAGAAEAGGAEGAAADAVPESLEGIFGRVAPEAASDTLAEAGLSALVKRYLPALAGAGVGGAIPLAVMEMARTQEADPHGGENMDNAMRAQAWKTKDKLQAGRSPLDTVDHTVGTGDSELDRLFASHLKRNGGAARNQ